MPLDNKFIVLDISGLSDDMIADGTFWATDVAYDLIMNAGTELSALLADELWSLVGASSNPQAAGFYEHMGFQTYRRTECDEQGGPYPLLYMRLAREPAKTDGRRDGPQ